jgi:hypothetical protein
MATIVVGCIRRRSSGEPSQQWSAQSGAVADGYRGFTLA